MIGERAGIPLCTSCISKLRGAAYLKDVFERTKEDGMLAGAFVVDSRQWASVCWWPMICTAPSRLRARLQNCCSTQVRRRRSIC